MVAEEREADGGGGRGPGGETVFVYGTLTDPDRVAAVLDSFRFAGRAVLDGLHRVDGRYPTLAPGGAVPGRLLVTDDLAALDAYEGVADGLYVRVGVPVAAGLASGTPVGAAGEAWLYVGDPARLDAAADWPGDGSFEECVRQYLAANAVVVGSPDADSPGA